MSANTPIIFYKILKYNDENSLSCVIQIAYYQAQEKYMLVREMPAGKGFCDIAFIPRAKSNDPAIIVELKWNQSARTAIDQIKEKQYSERLQEYYREVLLVEISYDKNNKKHRCRIEKVYKE